MLISVSYAIFVFASSSANPFVAPNNRIMRRHWRLGRAMGLSSLVAGSLTILVFNIYGVDLRIALVMYLVLISLLTIPAIIKYRKKSLWG